MRAEIALEFDTRAGNVAAFLQDLRHTQVRLRKLRNTRPQVAQRFVGIPIPQSQRDAQNIVAHNLGRFECQRLSSRLLGLRDVPQTKSRRAQTGPGLGPRRSPLQHRAQMDNGARIVALLQVQARQCGMDSGEVGIGHQGALEVSGGLVELLLSPSRFTFFRFLEGRAGWPVLQFLCDVLNGVVERSRFRHAGGGSPQIRHALCVVRIHQ